MVFQGKTMGDLVEELKQHLIQTLNLEEITPDKIDPGAPLFGDGLGLDSIDALELTVMLEEQYGIRITDLEVARAAFSSVNSLAKFIEDNPESQ
jgi:acyl carrier protein